MPRAAETFGSYKSKHLGASGISRLSRGIKATLTFSRLHTRRPSRVRVTYTQKLTPPACRERLRAHSAGSTGHRVKYDCTPANVRRMGRMGTRDRGISGGWGCKVERGKLKEIYLDRERKRRNEREIDRVTERKREECAGSSLCTQRHLRIFPFSLCLTGYRRFGPQLLFTSGDE